MMGIVRTLFAAGMLMGAMSAAQAATLFHDLYVTINSNVGLVACRPCIRWRVDTLRLDLRADMVIEQVRGG